MRMNIDLLPDGEVLEGAFTAGKWYGGQFTALYALASSGALELREGEGLGRLKTELVEAVADAESQGEWADAESMGALLAWVTAEMIGA